jgi:calcineurin-like phosphoesterase family protein
MARDAVAKAPALALTALALLASPAAAQADPVVAAAGDIACAANAKPESCRQMTTSDLVVAMAPLDAVLAVGDLQYECGELSSFEAFYDPSWGRVRQMTHPTPGNHEYEINGCLEPTTGGGDGYFSYFGDAAAPRDPGCVTLCATYYSFDVGQWHIVALNSMCSKVGGCQAGSRQERWLRADLAATTQSCILAYWHHPRYASNARVNVRVHPLWTALYDAGADLVLSGHVHNYERFARLGRGTPDSALPTVDADGMREIVVGTGGSSHQGFGTVVPGSQVRNATVFGVLKLVLHPGSYGWDFVPEAGKTFSESGSDTCHAGPRGQDSVPPSTPDNLSAIPVGPTEVDLSWTASSDNVGVKSYGIYRDGALIATTSSTSFPDSTAQRGTTYTYRVDAVDAARNRSPQSGPAPATTEISVTKARSAVFGSNSRATTLAVAAPAGVAAGDLMLASIDVIGVPGILPPSGWTLIRDDANGTSLTKATYYRVAGPSEPLSYTWRLSVPRAAAGGIVAYTGVDDSAPIDASSGFVNASSTAIKAPSVLATAPFERLVGLFGIASATTVTPPLGMTERGEVTSTAGTNVTAEISDAPREPSGRTGPRMATAANAGLSIGHLVALSPAP